MNIAVLFTGGTIGSTLAGDVIGTKTGAADGLLDTLPCVERDGHVEEITYQVYHPYTLLSEKYRINDRTVGSEHPRSGQ